MADSIFTKILKGELPSTKIYEDEKVFAILDISPVHKGHVLVIPKEDYKDIHHIPEELFVHLMVVTKRLAKAVKEATGADGINIIMNNEAAAGQVIFHAHVHIVPRFTEDGFKHWPSKKTYAEGEKEEYAEKIRAKLNS